jgi:hypothetical protein
LGFGKLSFSCEVLGEQSKMTGRTHAYWAKCVENRKACTLAVANGLHNAAASRYYYALRLASLAFFEIAKIEAVSKNKAGEPYWEHSDLINKLEDKLGTKYTDLEIGRWFKEAKKQRIVADYYTKSIQPEAFAFLVRKTTGIFTVIEHEITESKTTETY